MNKKIKVIELFNMIANGNIPEMIEYNCQRYQWYVDEYRRLEDDRRLTDLWIIEQILNDEVEILEDEEDDNISSLNAFKLMEAPYMAKCLDKNSHEEFMEYLKQSEVEIVHKIGELIEKVNKLDKKINKED